METNIGMEKNLQWNNTNVLKKEQETYNNPEKIHYICPYCQQIITLENKAFDEIILDCPSCGQKGIIRPFQKQQNITDTDVQKEISEHVSLIKKRKNINIPVTEAKILGILLILIGITLYYVFNLTSIKISLALIIIGVIIFTFIPNNRSIFLKSYKPNTTEKNTEKPKNKLDTNNYSLINYSFSFFKNQFDISEKIAITFILWIIFIYLLTGVNDIDIFLIFLFLGILLIKVLFDNLFPVQLRQKINIFIIAFLLIFIIIVIKRFLSLTNI